jgi:hypothetical protein
MLLRFEHKIRLTPRPIEERIMRIKGRTGRGVSIPVYLALKELIT